MPMGSLDTTGVHFMIGSIGRPGSLSESSHYPKVDRRERRGVDSGQKRQEEQEMQESWAQQEVGQAQLGHAARTTRLVHLVEDLVAHPAQSVPQACEDWAAT